MALLNKVRLVSVFFIFCSVADKRGEYNRFADLVMDRPYCTRYSAVSLVNEGANNRVGDIVICRLDGTSLC